jgi:hypothetical protein
MFIGAEDIKEISPTQKVGEISVSDLERRFDKLEKQQKTLIILAIIVILFTAFNKK